MMVAIAWILVDVALVVWLVSLLIRHHLAKRRFERWKRELDLDTRRRMDEMKRLLTPGLKSAFGRPQPWTGE